MPLRKKATDLVLSVWPIPRLWPACIVLTGTGPFTATRPASISLQYPRPDKTYRKDVYKIVFYGRPSTPRNDFELLAEIFKKVKAELGKRVEIYSVGEDYEPSRYALDGVVVNLGVQRYEPLGRNLS